MALYAAQNGRSMRAVMYIIAGLVLSYFALVAFVYVRQPKMLYYPVKEMGATPAEIGLAHDEITIRTSDGLHISAWYIPAPGARGTILFCHGNAGNISHRLDSIRIFHELSLNVLIFDYRGYGKSEGAPDEQGTYRDAEAAWDYLVNVIKIDPSRIVVFGRSLGSAVAAELAMRRTAGALILESGFTSVPDLGSRLFPHLPVRLISRYHYATIDKVGRISIPKLIIHSPDDEIIPFEQGRRLFELAVEPKSFLELRGSHNEGFLLSGDRYIKGLENFLAGTL